MDNGLIMQIMQTMNQLLEPIRQQINQIEVSSKVNTEVLKKHLDDLQVQLEERLRKVESVADESDELNIRMKERLEVIGENATQTEINVTAGDVEHLDASTNTNTKK